MPTLELLRAWLATTYRVQLPDGPVDLRIGQTSAALDEFLERLGVERWVIISAANPRSQLLSDAENQRRQEELGRAIQQAGFACFPGENQSRSGDWPVERTWLVPGLDEKAATALAERFEQHGLVGGRCGAPAELVFTRPTDWQAVVEAGSSDADPLVRQVCGQLRQGILREI